MLSNSQSDTGHNEQNPASLRQRLAAGLAKRFRIVLYLCCALSVAGYFGDEFLLLELLSHPRFHFWGTLVVGSIWLAATRQWRTLVPVGACCTLVSFSVLPWFFGGSSTGGETQGANVKLLLANVHTGNTNHAAVLELIDAEEPDVIVLEEVNNTWLAALAPLEDKYPFFLYEGRSDNFGIAIWSRLELAGLRIEYFGPAQVPSIVGELNLGGTPVTLIATHPIPPIETGYMEMRNEQLASVAEFAAHAPATIVIGDMNMTMWSPEHGKFEAASGLRNARRGFGILPTWPAALGVLGIPLDHCFVSASISVTSLSVGSDVGSDHSPLIVECSLR